MLFLPRVEKLPKVAAAKTMQFQHCPLCGTVKSRLLAALRGEELRSDGEEEGLRGLSAAVKLLPRYKSDDSEKEGRGVFLSLSFSSSC